MRQGWILTASTLILLFATQCVLNADAAKFIRNGQTQTCLEHTGSSSSCSLVSMTACPADRFASTPDSLQWNVIPVNPSEPVNNASEVLVQSSDASVCLTASSSVSIEACPCEDGKPTQRWKPNGDNWMSSFNDGRCLAIIGDEVTLGPCKPGASQSSWNAYHAMPDAVYAYTKSLFDGKTSRLSPGTFGRDSLPSEMFSGPFSLEVPPGFQFVVESDNGNGETFDSDIAQMDPISAVAKITVSLKPGMITYEHATYFGTSEYFANGDVASDNSNLIGSILVAKGFRGVMHDPKGNNVGLFEPIANFTGVMTATQQVSTGSFDVSSAKCSKECASGGFCSGEGGCTCKSGFAGDQCDKCASGFWGPTCDSCAKKCGNDPHFTCDDGFTGTGECKCAEGFTGDKCDQCAPGFFGSDCKACNCGQGLCNDKGECTCSAGWANGPKDNCSVCAKGYYLNAGSCVACAPGCEECENGSGECTTCVSGAVKDTDNPSKCVTQNCPDGTYPAGSGCQPCDPACQTCTGNGPASCLLCKEGNYHLQGSCFPATKDGKCQADADGNFFASNDPESQGICEPCPGGCTDCSYNVVFSGSTLRKNLVCTNCGPGFVLDDGQCKESCPDGKYLQNGECQECDQKCAKCTGPTDNECLACTDSSLFAKNGVCSPEECGSGFFASNTTCTKCHPDCAECSGPNANQCTKCPANRPTLNADNQCVPVCKEGNYAESGTCKPCNDDCSSCVGPGNDQCLSCSDLSKVLIEGSCTGSCPSGSTLLQTERICMRDNSVVAADNNDDDEKHRSLSWWAIVLIVLAIVAILAAILLLYRHHAIKRRQEKVDEFGRNLDANIVEKNLQRLREEEEGIQRGSTASGGPPVPEATYRPISKDSFRMQELGVVRQTLPPNYDHRDGERYWRNETAKRLVDYSDRRSARSDDWAGFEIAVLDEKGKVSVGSPRKAAMRNGLNSRPPSKESKGSNSWGDNWI